MAKQNKRFVEAMQGIAEHLGEDVPEVRGLLDKVRDGNLEPGEALEQMSTMLMQHPKVLEKIQVSLNRSLGEGEGENEQRAVLAIEKLDDKALAEIGVRRDLILYKDQDTGQLRVNPLYEAAIIERVQFDGDIPELRMSGDIPEGGTPAVPVENTGMSAVSLGHKLLSAQTDVIQQIAELAEARKESLDAGLAEHAASSLGSDPEERALSNMVAEGALRELEKPLDVEGYRRGEKAEMRRVEAPTGSELAMLSEPERQVLAWKSVATTQGRRSSISVICDLISKRLVRKGFQVSAAREWTSREALAKASWVTGVSLDEHSVQPSFSPIRVSGTSMGNKFVKDLEETKVNYSVELEVEVTLCDDLSQGQVGWKSKVVVAKSLPQLSEVKDGDPE